MSVYGTQIEQARGMRALFLVVLLVGCGGRVQETPGSGSGNVTGGPSDDDAGSVSDAASSPGSTPTSPPDTGAVVEPSPGCSPQKQGSDTSCKHTDTWTKYAADDCATMGMTFDKILAFEDDCGGAYRYVSYSCCPVASIDAGPPTDVGSSIPTDAGSALLSTCPTDPTKYDGAACAEPLWCDYTDACGNVNNWHCKYGTFQMNTWHACSK